MILASRSITDHTLGVSYALDTYAAFGNDGNSYNLQLNCSANGPVPTNVCQALRQMSDHLPVVMELVFDGAVSISDNLTASGFDIRLQDHPDTEQWVLAISGDGAEVIPLEMSVTDMTGRLVIAPAITGAQEVVIPTHQLPPGIYIIRLRDRQGKYWARKIIKANS
jgi:hypothetical protein